MKYKTFLLGKYLIETKSKYISKYVNDFEFVDINLVILSVTSRNITIASVQQF